VGSAHYIVLERKIEGISDDRLRKNMILRMAQSLACGAALIFAGCTSSHEPASPSSGVFRGRYKRDFEVSSFTPCDSSERWWVSGEVLPLRAPLGEKTGTVYAEVRGDLSSKGSYGHLGAYSRELVVREVVTTRLPSDKDCQ